jgi:hypothetical protein
MKNLTTSLCLTIVLILITVGLTGCKEDRSYSEIISNAIDGKIKNNSYWLLMSTADEGFNDDGVGWGKIILVYGFLRNKKICEELIIWGKSNPVRAGRKFRCEVMR